MRQCGSPSPSYCRERERGGGNHRIGTTLRLRFRLRFKVKEGARVRVRVASLSQWPAKDDILRHVAVQAPLAAAAAVYQQVSKDYTTHIITYSSHTLRPGSHHVTVQLFHGRQRLGRRKLLQVEEQQLGQAPGVEGVGHGVVEVVHLGPGLDQAQQALGVPMQAGDLQQAGGTACMSNSCTNRCQTIAQTLETRAFVFRYRWMPNCCKFTYAQGIGYLCASPAKQKCKSLKFEFNLRLTWSSTSPLMKVIGCAIDTSQGTPQLLWNLRMGTRACQQFDLI